MSSNPSWITRFGFARTPFGKAIPASDLFSRPSHEEAVARVPFCVQERLLGVIVGEVGVGKTVALRAASLSSIPPLTRSSTSPTQRRRPRPRPPPARHLLPPALVRRSGLSTLSPLRLDPRHLRHPRRRSTCPR
jgi:hypothetical protein